MRSKFSIFNLINKDLLPKKPVLVAQYYKVYEGLQFVPSLKKALNYSVLSFNSRMNLIIFTNHFYIFLFLSWSTLPQVSKCLSNSSIKSEIVSFLMFK